MGYLAYNDYLRREPLVFFSDGAAHIHNEIKGLYHCTDYKIILDWRRLQKRFRELFSMSFKGKDIRNAYRWSALPLLWRGAIDKADSVMENADP
jgi:hypothetical protein